MKLVIGSIGVAAAAAVEECYLPVDMMFLQDTTESFVKNLPIVTAKIPELITAINVQNPESLFGVSEFRDKPYNDLGRIGDFCWRLSTPLTADGNIAQSGYGKLVAGGGGDMPEASLEALINLVVSKRVGWRDVASGQISKSETGARVVILSTDAKPHDYNDYWFYNGRYPDEPIPLPPIPPFTMIPWPADTTHIAPEILCWKYEYPTDVQAAAALKAKNVHLIVLVPKEDDGVVQRWKEISTLMGQPESFVQIIQNDSSDLVTVVLAALKEVKDFVCAQTPAPATTLAVTTTLSADTTMSPTTTPAPSTTPSTTTTVPVTPGTTVTTPASTSTMAEVTTTLSQTVTTVPTMTPESASTTHPTTTAPITNPTTLTTTSQKECLCKECPCGPSLYIKVNNRPKQLSVHYEKAD